MNTNKAQRLGDYPLTVTSADGQDEILFGQLAVIPKSQIRYNLSNRDKVNKLIGTMENKIRNNGKEKLVFIEIELKNTENED